MKKLIGMSLALVISAWSFGQNDQIQNKKEQDLMPVAGEIGIGVNAIPVFNYFGDIFGLNTNNTTLDTNKFIGYFGQQSLFGKYMLTDDNAIRVNLRVGQLNVATASDVINDAAGNPDSLTVDYATSRQSDINVGIGYEFRRGKTRLRGIYGGEILWGRSRSHVNYTYGNAFGVTNPAPGTTDFGGGVTPLGTAAQVSRTISINNSAVNTLGLRVFAGIEYYFAPKICVGTEFGWSISGAWSGKSTSTTEFWSPLAVDPATGSVGAVISDESLGFTQNAFQMDTDNFNGAVYFLFWF